LVDNSRQHLVVYTDDYKKVKQMRLQRAVEIGRRVSFAEMFNIILKEYKKTLEE
jgi:hypothetical protein